MKIGTISENLEDYLFIIYNLLQENNVARVKDIASRKDVKMSSVSSALKRLTKNGLIDYAARDKVSITKDGEILVRRLSNRREQVSRFLYSVLGVSYDIAQKDAGGMEHHVSLETLDRLAAFQGFLNNSEISELKISEKFRKYYKHCLDANGTDSKVIESDCSKMNASETLLDLQPGERCIVKKLIAKSAIRQRLVDMGFLPNVEVLMERVAPLGDPIEVKIKGFHLSLRNEEASRILIKRLDREPAKMTN